MTLQYMKLTSMTSVSYMNHFQFHVFFLSDPAVPDGIQEEKGVKYEFRLYQRELTNWLHCRINESKVYIFKILIDFDTHNKDTFVQVVSLGVIGPPIWNRTGVNSNLDTFTYRHFFSCNESTKIVRLLKRHPTMGLSFVCYCK